MNILIYNRVREFLDENESTLLVRESVSQLLLFNALVNQDADTSKELLFGKVMDEDSNIVMLFCNVLPYNLLVYPIQNDCLKESTKILVDYIIGNDILIKGINGNKRVCDVFFEMLIGSKKDLLYNEKLAMDIMELTALTDINLAKGISRKAEVSECNSIAKWIIEFAKEALGEELLYEEQVIKAIRLIESGKLYVFEIPGYGIVSMAAASRQLKNGVCINYVYTPKEFRGKGYAASNMHNLCRVILEQGNTFCTLFVDKNNPISNRVYKKIGFNIIEDQYDYRIKNSLD